jgi:hypothetical protein
MPPRRETPAASSVAANVPPGPDQVEVRVNGKIAWMQRVHGRPTFDDQGDDQGDKVVITAVLRLPDDASQ